VVTAEAARYLTAEEVADRYRVSVSALYTQRHRREDPGALALKIGRRLLWRPADLTRWEDRLLGGGSDGDAPADPE
jgi:hypothetical protein